MAKQGELTDLWQPTGPSASPAVESRQGNEGFSISLLAATGRTVAPATLVFRRGLNIVSGPSNTGKSFAFYLLDYALGSRRLRKSVPVATQYEQVWVEIETYAGAVHTIARSLSHGGIRWYDLPYSEIHPSTTWEKVGAKHSANDSLSKRLLAICGLADREVRRNKRLNQSLSFRNITDFVLIDEQRIITDGSPVIGPNAVENPAQRSVFQLLLSGLDARSFPLGEDPVESRHKFQARIEFLTELINELPEIGDGGSDISDLYQAEDAAAVLREISSSIAEVAARISSLSHSAGSMQDQLRFERSRLAGNLELMQRFLLLRDSYRSDVQRLHFLSVGSSVFDALPASQCPLCGHEILVGDDSSNGAGAEQLGTGIQDACAVEEHKIRLHLNGLDEAIRSLQQETDELTSQVESLTDQSEQIAAEMASNLEPHYEELNSRLQSALHMYSDRASLAIASEQRASLVRARFELQTQLVRLPKGKLPKGSIQVDTAAFTEMIREILSTWNFPDLTTVAYDFDLDDLIVSDHPRSSEGKGVRAILYAAFIIALMRYSRAQSTGHPGFVVLDSPLTTYRRPDSAAQISSVVAENSEDVSPDLQAAFFRDLTQYYYESSRSMHEQVIIFENKQPPANTYSDMSITRFVGRGGVGRVGFIPGSPE